MKFLLNNTRVYSNNITADRAKVVFTTIVKPTVDGKNERKKTTSDPFYTCTDRVQACSMLTGPVAAAAMVFCVDPRGVVTATVDDAIYGRSLQRFDIINI